MGRARLPPGAVDERKGDEVRCPFCKENNDRVIDSRESTDAFVIRRRRECLSCHRRITTYERIEETPLRVVKKDGTRTPFERRKILIGLMKACEKRPVSSEMLEEITQKILSSRGAGADHSAADVNGDADAEGDGYVEE